MAAPLHGPALVAVALGWLAGLALQMQQAVVRPAGVAAGLCAGGVIVALLAWRWRARARAREVAVLLGAVAAALVAFGSTDLRAAARLAERLDPALEGRDLVVTGLVASLPQRGPAGVRFRFAVEAAVDEAGAPVVLPRELSLGWYTGAHEDAVGLLPPHALRAGDRWRFTLRLRQPHGTLNPQGFDLERWLFEQGLRATGYVRPGPAALLEERAGAPVERLRQALRDAIEVRVPERRTAGVLAALAVGDQSAIDRDDWDLFRATGVAHLMSISGLHVTMFAWLAGGVVGWLWRRSPGALLAWPAPLAARWGGLACAAAYAVLAGFGVPAQRTLWMLAAVALLPTLGVVWPWPLVLLAAALLVTTIDPWAVGQPGFWLSFGAVGLLLASVPARAAQAPPPTGWRARLRQTLAAGLRTQVVATLGLAPLTLMLFQQTSVVGFLANLVAIPVVTLLVTPLALAGVVFAPLWSLAAGLVQALATVLGALADWPGAVWTAAAAPAWAQAAALLGGALLVMPLPWRLRLLALPLALPLVLPAVPRPPPGVFELVAVDVGQGTAVLVRTASHLLVVDAGPQYARDSDAGERVLVPLLRARGERRIDRLVLSHRDVDHVGGAAALLRSLPVGEVWSSLEAGHPLVGAARRHRACEDGQRWTWDGVDFAVLHPAPGDAPAGAKPNARSCVLRVSAPGGSVLLPGDIEREQELGLVDRHGAVLRSTVLLVPHHGSRTSSIAPLLDAVAPQVAVVQAGYRNRFGHPAPDVLARYAARGIPVVASPACGAWTWRSDRPEGVCLRDAARRYWHHGPAP
jgi:competence protein ComEC